MGALFASNSLLDKSADDVVEEGLLTAKDKTTIMIMGVDERDDDVGRSDTLMVATLDPKKDQAALMSVPRDTRVKIKGHGWDKINAAYAYGSAKGGPEAGEKLAQRTVEDFLGVNMDHYVVVNIQAFQKIIDAIGGIDIDVEKRMYYEDPWDDDGGLIIDLQPGMQHMDGKTAVTYVRYRDEEGDIGRIKRQQKFMKACMDKVTSPAIIPKLPSAQGSPEERAQDRDGTGQAALHRRRQLLDPRPPEAAHDAGRDTRHHAERQREGTARTHAARVRELHPGGCHLYPVDDEGEEQLEHEQCQEFKLEQEQLKQQQFQFEEHEPLELRGHERSLYEQLACRQLPHDSSPC